jgi:sulfoxide reductase heme-binding subunit YedZ
MVRWLAHGAAILPLLYLVIAALNSRLGADPQEVLLHELGIYSLWFLLATLSVTPFRILTKKMYLAPYRRMLGLYFFFYVSCHLTVYCWFYLGWSLHGFMDELVKRPYITLGFLGWFLTIPLAITSSRGMQKRLGAHWKKLHSLVYAVSILGLIHFLWQSKADLNRPLIYWFLFISLMLIRFWAKYRQKRRKTP